MTGAPPPAAEADSEPGQAAELRAMRRADELAARGLGTTSPNPVVGCVILDPSGATVGEGWHAYAGGPHAEVAALADAGERARGATAVVTLEPCARTGRTGPCTTALREAGIRRVVYAVSDPNPVMAGGADALRAAGIDVAGGLLQDEAARTNEAWLHAVRTGRPFVVWKYAAALDGQVAAADGTSTWITGEPARRDVHELRARVDAIAAGSGTVLTDDPELTVRLPGREPGRQPLRVVFDRRGRTPAAARVRNDRAQTLVTAGPPEQVLQELYARGVVSLLLEGGPTLAGAFWKAGLIDKVVGYVAPVLLGSGAYPVLRDAGILSMSGAPRLQLTDVTRIGDDVRLTCYPADRGIPTGAKGR